MQIINHKPYTVNALEDCPNAPELFTISTQKLNSSELVYSLGSGTALGMFRDDDLIPTDTDIDFMIFVQSEADIDKVKELFETFPLAVEVIDGDQVQQLAYFVQNTIIDFHFYRVKGGFYHCSHQAGHLRFVPSPVVALATKYGPTSVVSNIEYMLEEEYGPDWRTPAFRKKGIFTKYGSGLLFGCFDPLHYGHVRLFQRCYDRCELLSVVIRSDAHMVKYKGREPYFTQLQRAKDIESMVDKVYLDDEDLGFLSFYLWTEKLQPDVFFASEENIGKIELQVPIIYQPRTPGISSSTLRKALENT